jgi:hypothetical protein
VVGALVVKVEALAEGLLTGAVEEVMVMELAPNCSEWCAAAPRTATARLLSKPV